MSDAGKMSQEKRKDEVKQDAEQERHNVQAPSTPAENRVTSDAQDDNQKKFLEAMFAYNRGKVTQQMWNIFNS